MFAPFISLAVFITMLASTANTVNVPSHALPRASITRRTGTEQVTIACHTDGAPACICPKDLNGDTGVLINVYPGYQCAYRNGACTWSDQDGALQNTMQTNCPTVAPCGSAGCSCPVDNMGDDGVMINEFTGYQCAYYGGACTWDYSGALTNTMQTNCPLLAPCEALRRL